VLDQNLADVEIALNFCSRIPVIHVLSGAVRGLIARVQMVASLVFCIHKLLSAAIRLDMRPAWEVKRGLVVGLHGLGNEVRAYLEMLPLSWILMYIYDYGVGRWNYPRETVDADVYPLCAPFRVRFARNEG
jgi:hypothetical protein